ncbi:uncharacterized protein LOC111262072 isoform X5 [Varroa jacobsoni]|uniref:uncharacterized protein LOC111262072 isoform X5 n=1 Tax=Varroa jacobsoni TaxID=62625 RepID=UPI000BF4AE72|nr:uncharacterized protein LOC111262072 isoform X5 [Varroa jacobsoni]
MNSLAHHDVLASGLIRKETVLGGLVNPVVDATHHSHHSQQLSRLGSVVGGVGAASVGGGVTGGGRRDSNSSSEDSDIVRLFPKCKRSAAAGSASSNQQHNNSHNHSSSQNHCNNLSSASSGSSSRDSSSGIGIGCGSSGSIGTSTALTSPSPSSGGGGLGDRGPTGIGSSTAVTYSQQQTQQQHHHLQQQHHNLNQQTTSSTSTGTAIGGNNPNSLISNSNNHVPSVGISNGLSTTTSSASSASSANSSNSCNTHSSSIDHISNGPQQLQQKHGGLISSTQKLRGRGGARSDEEGNNIRFRESLTLGGGGGGGLRDLNQNNRDTMERSVAREQLSNQPQQQLNHHHPQNLNLNMNLNSMANTVDSSGSSHSVVGSGAGGDRTSSRTLDGLHHRSSHPQMTHFSSNASHKSQKFLRSADAFISSPTDNENFLLEQHRESRDRDQRERDREETVNITDNLLCEVAPRGVMEQDGTVASNLHGTTTRAGTGSAYGFKEGRNSVGVTFKASETRERIEMAGGREVVSSAKKNSSVRAKKQRREPVNLMDDNKPLGSEGVLDPPSTMAATTTLPESTAISNGSLLDRGAERINRIERELVDVTRQHRQLQHHQPQQYQAQQQQQHDVVYDDIDDSGLMAPPSPTPCAPMHAGGLNGIQEEGSECSELPTHGGEGLGISRDLSSPGGVRVVSVLLGPSPPPPPPTLLNGHSAMNGGSSMKSLDELSCSNSCDTSTSQGDEGVARVIGTVPIAQYEGSPRRYGRPKRSSGLPGYPQRVYAPAKEKTNDNSDRPDRCDRELDRLERQQQDDADDKDLKKENEAVQLLSELLNGSVKNEKNGSPTDFNDLDYRLSYRPVTDRERDRQQTQLQQQQQQQHQGRGENNKGDRGGSSYVAHRLASPVKETRAGDVACPTGQASPGGSSCAPPVPPKLNLTSGTSPEEPQYTTIRKGGLKDHQGPTHGHTDAKEMVMLHERVQQHSLQVDMVGELDDFLGMDTSMRNLTVSPSVSNTDDCNTVDSDGTEGDPDELLSMANSGGSRLMPVLEDGLSSGHVSENDDDEDTGTTVGLIHGDRKMRGTRNRAVRTSALCRVQKSSKGNNRSQRRNKTHSAFAINCFDGDDVNTILEIPPSAPLLVGGIGVIGSGGSHMGGQASVSDAIREIKQAIQHSKAQQQQVKKSAADSGCVSPTDKSQRELREIRDRQMANSNQQLQQAGSHQSGNSQPPVWVPRMNSGFAHTGSNSAGTNDSTQQEDDCDTDQETDRLLGEQRSEDNGFYDEKSQSSTGNPNSNSKQRKTNIDNNNLRTTTTTSSSVTAASNGSGAAGSNHSSTNSTSNSTSNCTSTNSNQSSANSSNTTSKEVLIEGVLFRARYLGSTQLVCEGQPTKATRMMQAEEAVARIKAPEGESQPSTEVDLFISTEKIMVLNTDLKEIMMDHTLRTISYIADIGDLVVLMARRRPGTEPEDLPGTSPPPHCSSQQGEMKKKPKMICHVFESDEAQFIAQSIGQAFQVAYMEFLKANGIEDSSFIKEMDYQEVLNSQEIFGNELEMFAKKDRQKEVVVPKQKGEILGMVIVESGWGSMLPTVVIANMAGSGPAARCGMLNIGDQIIAINGVSLVGLPLSTCQTYIKNTKQQTVVKLTVVPCAPVVEVKIKRPDTKYQLGFSVQNGVICSLLRGGIAERGGVRVGHRIIEINGQSVVAVPHEKIVNLLATSVGEIHMKTMPTSMFRLLTGQESPVYI